MKLKNPNCICSEGGFFFIYDPFMEVPLETLNLSMDLEIRIAFQNLTTAAKKKSERKTSISVYSRGLQKSRKNPGKIPCSFASFLHERGAARGNRVT